MATDTDDGGTASPTSGMAALHELAPRAAAAFDTMVSVRPSGVHDEVLEDPAVRAFADQLREDASRVDEPLRAGLARATGDRFDAVMRIVWINDVAPRVRAALDDRFGPSQWPAPRRYPVADVSVAVLEFLDAVDALDRVHADSDAEAVARVLEAVRQSADEVVFAPAEDPSTTTA